MIVGQEERVSEREGWRSGTQVVNSYMRQKSQEQFSMYLSPGR